MGGGGGGSKAHGKQMESLSNDKAQFGVQGAKVPEPQHI